MTSLARSYRLCRGITRQKARNFFYAFLLLPGNRRNAICAVYAFMRHSDDLVDASRSEDRSSSLFQWREELKRALEGRPVRHPIFPAFVDAVHRFSVPTRYFFELLDGVAMDLNSERYQTFDELYRYCYHVASVVGLVCIHIFGFSKPEALPYAESAGIAFQLTNILRDLREDGLNNRVYLPQEDLKRFKVPEENLKAGIVDDRFQRLLHFEIERARDYYHQAEALVPLVSPDCRKALSALLALYRGLLEKINEEHERVLDRQIRLSFLEKLAIVVRAWREPVPAGAL